MAKKAHGKMAGRSPHEEAGEKMGAEGVTKQKSRGSKTPMKQGKSMTKSGKGKTSGRSY